MSEATELVSAASSADARVGLQAARALRRLAETLEAAQVDNARRQGWSWTEIAAAVLREAGVDAAWVRREIERLAGAVPPGLSDDDAALRMIGIHLNAVLGRIEQTLGLDACGPVTPSSARPARSTGTARPATPF